MDESERERYSDIHLDDEWDVEIPLSSDLQFKFNLLRVKLTEFISNYREKWFILYTHDRCVRFSKDDILSVLNKAEEHVNTNGSLNNSACRGAYFSGWYRWSAYAVVFGDTWDKALWLSVEIRCCDKYSNSFVTLVECRMQNGTYVITTINDEDTNWRKHSYSDPDFRCIII